MQVFTKSKAMNHKLIRAVAMGLAVVLTTVLLSQTVFAENTYVITDGDAVTVHTTRTSDPEKILDEAGLELGEEDLFTTQVTTEGVSEITVKRAQTITVYNCGEAVEVSSYGETLEALLNRLGIATYENVVSLPLETETYDGMQVSVDSIVYTEETYTQEIPYETIYCNDPTLPEGEEKVLSAGVAGQMLCTANVVYTNTQETSRTVLNETVLEQPVSAVVAVGTGENVGGTNKSPLIGDGVIVLPTGEVLTYTSAQQFKATAYTKTDAGCNDITATGTRVRKGVVAVDPKVIPYGTRMFIVTNDGQYIYGLATAEDCGGAIKGNRVDLYFDTTSECFTFGVRNCTIYFLG